LTPKQPARGCRGHSKAGGTFPISQGGALKGEGCSGEPDISSSSWDCGSGTTPRGWRSTAAGPQSSGLRAHSPRPIHEIRPYHAKAGADSSARKTTQKVRRWADATREKWYPFNRFDQASKGCLAQRRENLSQAAGDLHFSHDFGRNTLRVSNSFDVLLDPARTAKLGYYQRP